MSTYNIGLGILVLATLLDLSFNMARASFVPHKITPKTHVSTPTTIPIALTPKKLVVGQNTGVTLEHDEDTKTIYQYSKHGDIITRLYTLESSRGVNNAPVCAKKGLRNDFGFGLSIPLCYATLKDEVVAIDAWIDQHMSMSLTSMLCTWQTGKPTYTDKCTEVNKFMSLSITN